MTLHETSARLSRLATILPLGALLFLTACGSAAPDRASIAAQAQTVSIVAGSELRLARAARAAGDFASAVNLYRTIVKAGPDKESALVELGDTLLEANTVDDAIDAYERVPASSAARLGAELGLARAALKLAQTESALAHFEAAHGRAKEDLRPLLGIGVALDLLKRHDAAQQKYRAVLKLQPRHVAARNNLALSLALAGNYAEAVEILAPLAQSSTATPRIRQNLALIYGLKGDGRAAVALSRADLDATSAEANLRFFELVKGELSPTVN